MFSDFNLRRLPVRIHRYCRFVLQADFLSYRLTFERYLMRIMSQAIEYGSTNDWVGEHPGPGAFFLYLAGGPAACYEREVPVQSANREGKNIRKHLETFNL